jgi:hypothetical protein
MIESMRQLEGICKSGIAKFHLLLWRLFNWIQDLYVLSFFTRSAIPVMSLIMVLALFGYLSLQNTRKLLVPDLGRKLWSFMTLIQPPKHAKSRLFPVDATL